MRQQPSRALFRLAFLQNLFSPYADHAYEPLHAEEAQEAEARESSSLVGAMAAPTKSGLDPTTRAVSDVNDGGGDGAVNSDSRHHRPHPAMANRPMASDGGGTCSETVEASQGLYILESKSVRWWSYLATADFWIVVAIGQVLALCITATNTFTSFLQQENFSAPAFQTLFNYVLLAVVYNAVLLARDGPGAWARVARRNGWKYLVLAFLDVEGNYFTVLAYQYTNILSAQLLNFWSIVCVVAISFGLLRVRYRPFQVLGILVCCGGMGILLASDYMVQRDGGAPGGGETKLKGDLFGLLGATLYGTSNVLEEWLVSKAPMHHVLAFMGLFGAVVNGVQAAVFDRASIAAAAWSPSVAGHLAGYTLCLTLFYTLAPLILRMGSAAFFDISLLTANFWGVIVGIHVFGLSIHFLYPVAFVCIVVGLVLYFLSGGVLGDSKKPWLGENQEAGVAGIGTAKLRAINAARAAQGEAESGGGAASKIRALLGRKT
ncbi:uncharacterized protein UV8b_01838 [Ustilaginoidea virens]|uniref:Uncharacterized protein n=1 Tax=Ustilaginoidea virens TaxID=1159556 RepID=A0A063BKJ6_USTVR|nr:uncharacterized protein UV8b_01838 [Ustilaginoidea virens]QUC17597.1 hypothetical protein UV8b_01838 [Ustilaginoidea virens]GAO18671.1 hypothetical protein UVI_02059070 [Ustilaginoidea virens]